VKVLVATRRTQGQRPGDFCFTVDGELVGLPAMTCDCPDCGCDRAVGGLSSRKGTTTFTVVDRAELAAGDHRLLLRDGLVAAGWIEEGEREPWVDAYVEQHIALVAEFEVGDLLEIRNGRVVRRDVPTPSAD
jgi:hypothetical protein